MARILQAAKGAGELAHMQHEMTRMEGESAIPGTRLIRSPTVCGLSALYSRQSAKFGDYRGDFGLVRR